MYLKRKLGFLLLSLSSSAFAGGVYQPGEFYFAPGVAYYHFSEKRDLQNAAMANITAGIVLSSQFSLEAFYGQAATDSSPASDNDGTRFYSYGLNGVYHFKADDEAGFHPYILAGLNISNQDDDTASSEGNSTLLGVTAGAGIEYFVNPNISLFSDARNIYTLSGGKDDVMLNVGIKFLFDAKTPEEPVKPVETGGSTGFYELQE